MKSGHQDVKTEPAYHATVWKFDLVSASDVASLPALAKVSTHWEK